MDVADRGDPEEVKRVKKEFSRLCRSLDGLTPLSRARLHGRFAQMLLERTYAVDTPAGPLSFVVLGRSAPGRASKILTKQPATIRWIEAFRPQTVFWDVGANIGVYSLYAALLGQARVVAIEPAAVNYFMLACNCEVNRLDSRIACLLLGLGDEAAVKELDVSQFASAASFRFAGSRADEFTARQASLVVSIDRLVEEYGVSPPTYLKIDTPGMTEPILAGGERTLQREDVRELHIELREQSQTGQRIVERLQRWGFHIAARDLHGATSDVTFAKATPAGQDG